MKCLKKENADISMVIEFSKKIFLVIKLLKEKIRIYSRRIKGIHFFFLLYFQKLKVNVYYR